jgi:hypothetical protein
MTDQENAMSLLEELSFIEPITEPEILAGIEALPTEDELPCHDGESVDNGPMSCVSI